MLSTKRLERYLADHRHDSVVLLYSKALKNEMQTHKFAVQKAIVQGREENAK